MGERRGDRGCPGREVRLVDVAMWMRRAGRAHQLTLQVEPTARVLYSSGRDGRLKRTAHAGPHGINRKTETNPRLACGFVSVL